jgi:hypothetical protein
MGLCGVLGAMSARRHPLSPLLITALACAVLLGAAAETPGRLLVPGSVVDEADAAKTGDVWLCIGREGTLIRARLCPILIEPGEGPSEQPLDAAKMGELLFLVTGVDGLREGDVPTVTSEEVKLSKVGASVTLGFERAVLAVSGREGDYEIALRIGGKRHMGRPALLWAGDLDRDGKVDLLMDVSGHYSSMELRLYLSSRATPGELVREVALRSHPTC